MPEPAVELRDVHKSVREGDSVHHILAGVDLTIAPGEAVAILGRSGSGKSTLLNLIAGIDEADRGAIRTAGLDVTAAGERARAAMRSRRLGFVFQAFHLLPTLTVAENVALPLELANAPAASIGPRVQELLQRIGLQDRAEAWPEVLSGGEQQRLAVARRRITPARRSSLPLSSARPSRPGPPSGWRTPCCASASTTSPPRSHA
jgi:putative ABC transport system ATP-binding protein